MNVYIGKTKETAAPRQTLSIEIVSHSPHDHVPFLHMLTKKISKTEGLGVVFSPLQSILTMPTTTSKGFVCKRQEGPLLKCVVQTCIVAAFQLYTHALTECPPSVWAVGTNRISVSKQVKGHRVIFVDAGRMVVFGKITLKF